MIIKVMSVFLILLMFPSFAATYKYDNNNRITEATYKDGTVVSYSYDKNGNLLSVTPTESSSGGDDSGESDTGSGDTGGTDSTTPVTPEPQKQESSGGAFGWLNLLLILAFIVIRTRDRVRLKS
ncbi:MULTISPECIES: RHS repeat domain-containing protein [unclassified Pseudoalteromonas]|uniref:RHS repeat domain-containing protein n=1 Tax=unclassified Pseudoalteromonas TaxID=194690 RepID=UPI0030155B12